MNFYDVFPKPRNKSFIEYDYEKLTDVGSCCAVTEAVLQDAHHCGVDEFIKEACKFKRTLLFWHVLPKSSAFYRTREEEILCLPATTFLGEYKNKRSGRLIRSYVTNLQQEW